MLYYDRELLELRLSSGYDISMKLSKRAIDNGIDDTDALYDDLEKFAPLFKFRFREEEYEYNAIIRDWNSRFRSEVDSYLRKHEKVEQERERRRREEREREEREEREEEERMREAAEEESRERRRAEEKRRRAEAKKQERARKNREELDRIQAEWRKRHFAADAFRCPSCGAANDKAAKFCSKCGSHLQMKCASCGSLVRVGSNFCSKCGFKL